MAGPVKIVALCMLAGAICLFGVLSSGAPLNRRGGGGSIPQTCGPDSAPAQAVSAGFTCETYRWGSGDTLAEVDTTGSNAPGFKWYLGTALNNGWAASSGNLSFVSGKLVLNSVGSTPAHGSFVINTCGSTLGTAGYNVGTMFTGGWYVEVAMTFDGSGFTGVEQQLGFYGLTNELQLFNTGIEVDDPDYWAFSQSVVYWSGGSSDNASGASPVQANITVQTGDLWGFLATLSGVSYWYNNTANGTPNTTGHYPSPTLTTLNSQHMCFGWEVPTQYPVTIVSVKIWQAPP